MLLKWKLAILLLFTLFSNAALSADCEKLFNKLDKQHLTISGKDDHEKFIKMENELFDAIEECKTYSGMFVLMGELQIEMGQIPLAVVYGKKSVKLDAEYWRAHKLLGSAKMLNKESKDGLNSLKKAIDLNPTNLNIQLNFISALIQNEKYDQALKLINEVLNKGEKDTLAIAYYFRSQVYRGKGLITEENRDAKKAQDLGFTLEQRYR